MPSHAAVILALALAVSLATCADASLFMYQRARTSLASFDQDWAKPLREGIVQPMEYDQRLLVCNAFVSDLDNGPIRLRKDGDDVFDEKDAIVYPECRYAPVTVRKGDKLDFATTDGSAGGTFEVTDLPEEDAMLLLVLQNGINASFPITSQSFTFPLHNMGKAQLAVVDATAGTSGKAQLRIIKDLPTKAEEELNFNEVYEIETGNYSVSLHGMVLEGAVHDLPHEAEMGKHSSEVLELQADQDYVILRTGSQSHEMLVTFPRNRSGCTISRPSYLLAAAAAALVGWLVW